MHLGKVLLPYETCSDLYILVVPSGFVYDGALLKSSCRMRQNVVKCRKHQKRLTVLCFILFKTTHMNWKPHTINKQLIT